MVPDTAEHKHSLVMFGIKFESFAKYIFDRNPSSICNVCTLLRNDEA